MKTIICFSILMMVCLKLLSQKIIEKDTVTGRLDQVVVSANKWEQNMNEIPNTIMKVDLSEARLQNPQTAADLLATTGQIFVQKSQLGGGSPMIRGFATNRVLIVVDGVRMNNAIYRSGNLQNVISIDALSVQNAEVIFGPGSIIYGSDAIGGVMDFHTFKPIFSTTKKLMMKANALLRSSSANQEKTTHADVSLGWKKWGFVGSITYSDFGDVQMGTNGGQDSYLRRNYVARINNKDSILQNANAYQQKHSGYLQWNGLAKLAYKPTENLELQYAFHYSATGNIPRYDRLIESTANMPTYAAWYYGPQLWKMHQFQAQHLAKNGLYDQAKIIGAYQIYEESRNDRRLNNARLRNQTEQVKVYTINIDFSKSLSQHSELFYGTEYVANKVGSIASRLNINTLMTEAAATRYPNNATWNSLGAYISYKNNLSEKLTLSTGLRYSYVTAEAPFDTTFFKFPFSNATLKDGGLTGNAGLVYRPADKWQINTNFSSGFRVPNIDDLGKIFDSEPGNVVVPNVALSSEYAYNIDLGVGYKLQRSLKFDITGFYTYLDKAIVRRPFTFNGADSIVYEGQLSKVQALQNVAFAKVWGVQAGFEWLFAKKIKWALRANYIDGKEIDDTKDEQVALRHAPPFYANSFVKFSDDNWTLEMNVFYNAALSNNRLAPSEQSKPFIYAKDANGRPYSPSWYTLNLKSSYRINAFAIVNVGLENITDQRYRPYASGIVAPGFNFVGSVRISL